MSNTADSANQSFINIFMWRSFKVTTQKRKKSRPDKEVGLQISNNLKMYRHIGTCLGTMNSLKDSIRRCL